MENFIFVSRRCMIKAFLDNYLNTSAEIKKGLLQTFNFLMLVRKYCVSHIFIIFCYYHCHMPIATNFNNQKTTISLAHLGIYKNLLTRDKVLRISNVGKNVKRVISSMNEICFSPFYIFYIFIHFPHGYMQKSTQSFPKDKCTDVLSLRKCIFWNTRNV